MERAPREGGDFIELLAVSTPPRAAARRRWIEVQAADGAKLSVRVKMAAAEVAAMIELTEQMRIVVAVQPVHFGCGHRCALGAVPLAAEGQPALGQDVCLP